MQLRKSRKFFLRQEVIGTVQLYQVQEGKYITMVCNSFGRLGVRGPLWQELSQRIRERVDWLAPVDLALTLGRFGESRCF